MYTLLFPNSCICNSSPEHSLWLVHIFHVCYCCYRTGLPLRMDPGAYRLDFATCHIGSVLQN